MEKKQQSKEEIRKQDVQTLEKFVRFACRMAGKDFNNSVLGITGEQAGEILLQYTAISELIVTSCEMLKKLAADSDFAGITELADTMQRGAANAALATVEKLIVDRAVMDSPVFAGADVLDLGEEGRRPLTRAGFTVHQGGKKPTLH